MKLIKTLTVAIAMLAATAPGWAIDPYFQSWDGPNSESGAPVTGGNIYGADIISRGILDNQLYMMMNDTSPFNNFFVAGYFQQFASGTVDFTGGVLSLDVKQIPVGGVLNTPPAGSHFFFELAFDKNGDGVYTDGIDNTWRTSLTGNPFILPGSDGTTFNIALNSSNFGIAGDVSGAFDLTKVTRVGFGILQNVPDNGLADFPDSTNLGWSFDNLQVVPEPGTWAMMAMGLVGVAGFLRRRK